MFWLKQCRRCGGTLSCDDLVLREGEHSFHVKCFACIVCLRQLQPGDQYVLNDMCNQICCKSCLDRNDVMRRTSYCVQEDSASDSEKSDEEVFTGHPGNFGPGRVPCFTTPSGMQHLNMMGTNKNGSKTSPSMGMVTSASDAKRAKRPRTILTTAQRRKFKASFEVSQKPCRKVRETLAAETGLSPRVVQVWFQNQRAKMKKIARRQPQGDGSGQGARSGCRSRRKKTTDSDSENDLSSPGSYTSMPTPHQNSIYSDTYRSPGSIQTSPTASVSEGSTIPYYQPAAQIHEPGEFMYEDDLENALLPMEQSSSTYLTPPLHTVMSSDTTSSMNIGPRLQLNLASQVNDYNNNNNSGGIGGLGDNASAATLQDICQPYHPTGPMNAFPTAQVTSEGNPINKLMYMQNNFFRT
ncbi:unnamed protein product [Clavelina lepadiformis]|uniref:Uncharacterized protein n=2 Tax=Clavelina lepadiformis TaxID=159417 RepID=A0ABP0F2B5_CLALP